MNHSVDLSSNAATYFGPAASGPGSLKALQASRIFYVEANTIVATAMNTFNSDPFIDPNTSFIDVQG